MVVPMKRQYEQHYNAAALKQMGVPVLKNLKKKRLEKIETWIDNHAIIPVEYKNITEEAVRNAILQGKNLD